MEVTPPFQTQTLHVYRYLDTGPIMFNDAPLPLDDVRRLHAWLGRYLRREDSKETRAAIADVEQQMIQQQQPEPPPPRDDLPVHFFVFDARDPDYPQTIGYKPGTIDRAGIDLVPAELVPEGHPLATHTFSAGAVIPATEADPQLISFLRSNRLFRRATIAEIQQQEHS